MNDNERRTRETFGRVRDFGEAHNSDFAATTLGHQYFTDMATAISDFDNHAAAESSGHGAARQGTETRAQARGSLRDAMETINRTAKALADDVAGIDDKFRMPRGTNDQTLLNAARAFKADAETFKAQFIAHEMPSAFLEDLQADIDALEEAISNQASGVGNHVAASAGLDAAVELGLDRIRKLDPIMRNKYANNPAVLAEWTSASHIERAPRRAAAAGGSTASGGGSTPPAPPTP